MTIRYKADHTIKREVTPLTPGAAWWVGQVDDYYSSATWEPVPGTRWVPANVKVVENVFTVFQKEIRMRLGERAIITDIGTVRFEREGEE